MVGAQQMPPVPRHDPPGNEVKRQMRVRTVIPERRDPRAGARDDGAGIGRVRSGQQPGTPVRNLGNGDREFSHGAVVRPAIVQRRSQWASATGTTDSRD